MFSKAVLSACAFTLLASVVPALLPMSALGKAHDFASVDWYESQQRSQALRSMTRSGSDKESSPPLQAFIEAFSPGGENSGFGEIHIRFKSGSQPTASQSHGYTARFHPGSALAKPEYAYVEVQGKRFYPQDTDSIRVWGITGVPFDKTHWVFVLAQGRVSAYAHFPGPTPMYFALGADESRSLRDSTKFFCTDSLERLLRRCPRAWAESEADPLLGVLVYNSAGDREMDVAYPVDGGHKNARLGYPTPIGKRAEVLAKMPHDYLFRAGLARSHCKQKLFQDAEKDLAVLRDLDSTYYQYYWAAAFCRENEGKHPEALRLYRQAYDMAPFDESLRKTLRKAMEKIQDRSQEKPDYIREEKVPKPRSYNFP